MEGKASRQSVLVWVGDASSSFGLECCGSLLWGAQMGVEGRSALVARLVCWKAISKARDGGSGDVLGDEVLRLKLEGRIRTN